MGNKESVDSGNSQRSFVRPISSFSAQRHFVHLESSHGHGQSSPVGGHQASAARLQSFPSSDDENGKGVSWLFEDELVARGSSAVVSNNNWRPQVKGSCQFTSNFPHEKEKERNDDQRRELSSPKTKARKNGMNDNSEFEIGQRSNVKVKAENRQNETAGDMIVASTGRRQNAVVEVKRYRGKISRTLQDDLQLVQNVMDWNLGSKDRHPATGSGRKSYDQKNIPRGRPSNSSVKFSAHNMCKAPDLSAISLPHFHGEMAAENGQMALENGQMAINNGRMAVNSGQMVINNDEMGVENVQMGVENGQMSIDNGEMAVNNGQHNEKQNQKGLSMVEVQSVESSGFSCQCESENQSLEDDLEMFSSQPQLHCLSIQKEQREITENNNFSHGSFEISGNGSRSIAAISDQSDNVLVSVANSHKKQPVESEDSAVLNSSGFNSVCSLENPVSQTAASTDIDFERFQACFDFCKKGKETLDRPFGSPFPSVTLEGFNSVQTSYPHSQTFHNDTGQFDVRIESRDTSRSSAISTESWFEPWPSVSSSGPTAEDTETTPLPDSHAFKSQFSNLACQSQRLQSFRREDGHGLKNDPEHKPALPEQNANMHGYNQRKQSNDINIVTDTAAKNINNNKIRAMDTTVSSDICPIFEKEKNAGFACSVFKPTATKNHLPVFSTTFLPTSTNSSPPSSPPPSLHHPKPDFTGNQRFSSTIPCNNVDDNGNVRITSTDGVDLGRRREENNNTKERADISNMQNVMWSRSGQFQKPQRRHPEERDAEVMVDVDDYVAAAGGAELPSRHGFHVAVDDPGGAASAFLRPVAGILSVSDRPGNPRFYAAYLLVADSDIESFGRPFLLKLESWGLSIFFRERDLILTGYEYENLSAIVEERCNGKVIVVVSKNYPQSPQCQYLTVFARNLDPDARKRNIIPVYIDKEIDDLPRVLTGLAIIRYNQVLRRGWLKDKILGALSS